MYPQSCLWSLDRLIFRFSKKVLERAEFTWSQKLNLRWIEQNTKLCPRLVFLHYFVGRWTWKDVFLTLYFGPPLPCWVQKDTFYLGWCSTHSAQPIRWWYCNNTEMHSVSFFTKCLLISDLVAVFAVEIFFGNHQTSDNPVLPGLAWHCAFWPSSHTKYRLFSGYVVVDVKS